ncbi:SWF or SNF family helicase [Streptomyces catenulae]|uniref:SWF or SNF family helicase n=1 Tax=Streptomyces catenulae TaxID=66875 RepID=A0ABV2YSW5_9ACTN|nr:SWF or SNF family helicase [Streptomyces catenulae]
MRAEYGEASSGGREAVPERTFAALPAVRGGAFAQSWWGRAWLKALEDTALDGQQVKQGRRHARAGAVGAVSVRPGRITAMVRDRDHTRHRTDVLLQQLDPREWDRLLDVMADRAGHIAALLDRDLPPVLAEDASDVGITLLPGIGDLESECSCEEWDHCAHSAALCYQLARLLDEDPFLLLLVRGRGERELLDELQARSAARAADASGERPPAVLGIPAAQVYAAREALPPLPDLPPPVDAWDDPAPLGGGTPPEPGVEVAALELLRADAAARARELPPLLLAARPGQLPPALTRAQDTVRLAAADPGPAAVARLAAGSGRDARTMALAVRAWRLGGAAALDVLEEDRVPDPADLVRARAQLAAAWPDAARPELRMARARWTVRGGAAQLRRGRDGRWWPYRKEQGRWAPAGAAAEDPAAALATAISGPDAPDRRDGAGGDAR